MNKKNIKKIIRFHLYSVITLLGTDLICAEKKTKNPNSAIKIPNRFNPVKETSNPLCKKKIRHIKLSNIDTSEKCAKLINIENEIVLISCKFCSNKEIGTLWIARYKAIKHRKIEHLICECNKRHETSYAAFYCQDCL